MSGARELALALALDRRVAARGASVRQELPEGLLILEPALPAIYSLNHLVLDAPLDPGLDAAAVIALTEHHLGHLPVPFVRIDDEAGAERLAAGFEAAGWQRQRTVLMVRRTGAEPPPPDPRARRVSAQEHHEVMLANLRATEYPDDIPGLPELLCDAQERMLAGTESRRYGAGVDGGLQSMCELYLDPDVDGVPMAMVEQVGTLPGYRERGLARAVTALALSEALDWGAELSYVPADADDWPQVIYAKLGFEPVGVQNCFVRRGSR